MRAINLLPRDEQRARLEGVRLPLLVAAAGVAAVSAAAFVLASSASSTAERRSAELAAIEATLARLPRPAPSAVSQGALVRERTNRLAALTAALSARVPFDRVLREVSYVLPRDAWLTGLQAAVASPAPAAPGRAPAPPASAETPAVTIEGATYTYEGVARVLARLAVAPSLENVQLASSTLVVPQATPPAVSSGSQPAQQAPVQKGKPYVSFTVTASLRVGGAS